MSSAISSAITMILLLIILPILVKNIKKKQTPTANQVRMPRFAFWVGIVGTVLFAGFLIASLIFLNKDALLMLILGVVFGGFTAMGIFEIVSAVNWGIDYDDSGFTFHTSMGKAIRFQYGDIKRVERMFNPMMQGYKVTIHAQGKKIKLDPLCIGQDEFLRHLERMQTGEQSTQRTSEIVLASPEAEAGSVRMPNANLWVGIICTAFFTAPLVWMILDPYALSSLSTESVLALVAFVLMGLYLILQYFNWRVDFDSQGFEYRNSFGSKKRYSYGDIQSQNSVTRNLVLNMSGKKLQIPLNAKGMYEFRKHVDKAFGTNVDGME